MGRHEVKREKKPRPVRQPRVPRQARPARQPRPGDYPRWAPPLLLVLPLLFVFVLALSLRAGFHAQAEAKAAILAESAARVLEEGQLSLSDGELLGGLAFGELFRLSDYPGGDEVTWGVYTLEGTQALLTAGTVTEPPSQRLILQARSDGTAVARRGDRSTAAAVVLRRGKPLGLMQITVDSGAYTARLTRRLIKTLGALGAAMLLTLVSYRLLGLLPALGRDIAPDRSWRGRLWRGGAVVLLLALFLGAGTWCLVGRREEERKEREELLLQADALLALRVLWTDRADQSARVEELGFEKDGLSYRLQILTAADREELGGGSRQDRRLAAAMEEAAQGGALLTGGGMVRALVPLDASRILMLSSPRAPVLRRGLPWVLGIAGALLPGLALILPGRRKPRFSEEVVEREA